MKILIDTKQDSPEEIKHIINMLTAIIGEKMISSATEQTTEQNEGYKDIFSIFGSPKTEAEEEKTQETQEIEEEESVDIKDFDINNLETY